MKEKNWKEELKKCFPVIEKGGLICPKCNYISFKKEKNFDLSCQTWLSTNKRCDGILMSDFFYAKEKIEQLISQVEQEAYKNGLKEGGRLVAQEIKEEIYQAWKYGDLRGGNFKNCLEQIFNKH